ncbi:MAG: hypothetical protein ACXWU0_08325, partial [Rhodoplanes sp.]
FANHPILESETAYAVEENLSLTIAVAQPGQLHQFVEAASAEVAPSIWGQWKNRRVSIAMLSAIPNPTIHLSITNSASIRLKRFS